MSSCTTKGMVGGVFFVLTFGGLGAEPEKAASSEEESDFAPNDRLVEQQADPFATPDSMPAFRLPASRLEEKRESLQVRFEVWEVGSRDLVIAMDGFDGPASTGDWRGKQLEAGTARLIHAPVAMVEEKSANESDSIVEEIYPTEYDPSEGLQGEVAQVPIDEKAPKTVGELIEKLGGEAIPTAFETRNTGLSVEVAAHPVTGEDDCWDLSLHLQDVKLLEMVAFQPHELQVQMPRFSSFKTGGLHRVNAGQWKLVSVLPKPGADEESAGLSWVTLVKVDGAR